MNLCPQGHDKDVVGTSAHYGCPQCKRDSSRARRAHRKTVCSHAGPCMPVINRAGQSYCQVKRVAVNRANGRSKDGFEDEFGLKPKRVRPSAWVDRVVLERHLADRRTGRDLTSGEYRALHLLKILRGDRGVREEAEELVSA